MGGRGTLGRAHEQREQVRRQNEFAREEITRYYGNQRHIDAVSDNMQKDDFRRKEREARERAQEANMLDGLYRNEKTKELNTIKATEEERIATVLAQRQQQRDRTQKEVQMLREQSEELRELAEKIRMARANKERALQVQEKTQIKQQQLEYDRNFDEIMGQHTQAAIKKDVEHQQARREQNIQAKRVLEEQMHERVEAQRLAEIEFQRERAMVDEVVRRILEEDRVEAVLKKQKQEETKDFIARFLQEQEVARTQKLLRDNQEERQRQEYWQQVHDREAAEKAAKAAQKEVADRIYEKLKREKEEEMRLKEEEDALINLLYQEELEAKKRAEEQAKKERAVQMREEMKRANEHQLKLKEEREAALRREEEEFRAKMMAKFAEDDRIEQLNAQKRRMKLQDHKREVERLIEEKRAMYEALKAQDEADIAALKAEEDRRAAIIESERMRLLREAAELLDYLPKGVLRDKSDLDYVNQLAAQMQGSSLGR